MAETLGKEPETMGQMMGQPEASEKNPSIPAASETAYGGDQIRHSLDDYAPDLAGKLQGDEAFVLPCLLPQRALPPENWRGPWLFWDGITR